MKKILYLITVTFMLIILGFTYYWGYLCGKREMILSNYEELLVDISNNILIFDSIRIKRSEEVKPLIISSLESDFSNMIGLYMAHKFEKGGYLRCAVSRRMRALKNSGDIFAGEQANIDYPIHVISGYLEAECEGPPSHENWLLTGEENKSGQVENE